MQSPSVTQRAEYLRNLWLAGIAPEKAALEYNKRATQRSHKLSVSAVKLLFREFDNGFTDKGQFYDVGFPIIKSG